MLINVLKREESACAANSLKEGASSGCCDINEDLVLLITISCEYPFTASKSSNVCLFNVFSRVNVILFQKLEEKKEKSKKKKGKKKGKKKQRKSSSSSDESDDELLNKYLAIVEQKKKKSGLTEQKGHDGRRQEKHGSNGQTSSRSKCDSDVRNRSFSNEKKSLGEKLKSDRKRRESVHSDSEEGSDRERRTSRHRSEAGEQHKGRMLHNSKDDDDGKRFKKYGLNVSRDFVVYTFLC